MRVDIYTHNEQKIFDAIARIREQSGQDLTPSRLVNIILEAGVERIEMDQTITLVLRSNPGAGKEGFSRPKVSKVIRKKTPWAANF